MLESILIDIRNHLVSAQVGTLNNPDNEDSHYKEKGLVWILGSSIKTNRKKSVLLDAHGYISKAIKSIDQCLEKPSKNKKIIKLRKADEQYACMLFVA